MTLQQGYNIVTERLIETDSELGALSFFRALASNDAIETPVTVTSLEDLLYNASGDDRSAILAVLRQTIRQSRSLGTMDAVQFLIDGRLVEDDEFRVRVERSGDVEYLDVGQLFVEEPQRMSPTQAVARK
ncbi:hypothetical protein [Halomarina ordinaria]|uniref:DUF8076 domain-containing protein n=1 Tax=Halomarina ordinaria TaxID=3033939 RepID=A0ABD5U3S2_9EURY|nr:hypothetical protein [Halomarina sp. PSRA2]